MPLPKYAFACNICQKPFNNPTILIKHVEFRHSTEEQTPKSKSGSEPKEKDVISNANRDPLEIHVINSVTPFELVPIQEYVKNPVNDEGQTEGINHLTEKSSLDQVPGNVRVANIVFKKELLQFEHRNNGDTANAFSSTLKDVVVTQNKSILNENSSANVNKGTENLKYQMNCTSSDALVVGNQHNSSLETNAIIRSPEHLKPENIFKPRTLQSIDKIYSSVTSDKQYHDGKNLQKCFVKIQKLPSTYDTFTKRMNRERDQNRHIKSVHEEKKSFKCNVCDYTCSQKHSLRRHTALVHERKKRFKCNGCDKAYYEKQDMKRHIESVHEGKKPFKCDICDYSCFRKIHMNIHVASVHEGKKPFKCDACDYRCSRKNTLKTHVDSVHEGKKPFKCEVCEHTCSQKYNLKKHVESVHDGKKPLKCGICEYSCSQKYQLKQHVASVHQ